MNSERWTRLSKIYRSMSSDECRELKGVAYDDGQGISAVARQKFLEFKLITIEDGKVVITLDGKKIAGWC